MLRISEVEFNSSPLWINKKKQTVILIFSPFCFLQMAEVVQEKSRGLKFAEQQLLRHGWEQGKDSLDPFVLCHS